MVRTLLSTSFNSGMSLQALMALLGHVSTEMTLRYAALAAPAVRIAYEEAMSKARTRLTLAIAPVGQPIIPGRVEWLRAEMLKTRVAHGYCCSRSLKMTTWASLLVMMLRMLEGPAGVVRRGLGVRAGGVVVSLT